MRLDGKIVSRGDALRRISERRGATAGVRADVVFARLGSADVIPELRALRQPSPIRPTRFQFAACLNGAPFGRGDDAEEVAFAYYFDKTWSVVHRGLVHALQIGADGQRSDDSTVKHAIDAEILHVSEARGDLGR